MTSLIDLRIAARCDGSVRLFLPVKRAVPAWIGWGLVLFWLAGGDSAAAWQVERAAPFENPPLRYEGPDPTSGFFLYPRTAANVPAASGPAARDSAANVAAANVAGGGVTEWRSAGTDPIPPLAVEALPLPGDAPLLAEELLRDEGFVGGGVTDFKDGFFQKFSVTETWLDRPHFDDYGLHELDVFAMFALPAPSREWPLLITPTFNTRLVDGPVTPDLPSRLYESYLDLLWVPRLSPEWTAIVGVAPSYYGDFRADNSEAFRLTGKGLARYDWSPGRVQLLFGALYLNRNDVRILPAGGVIWTPNDAIRYEILFPKPKLAHRITLGDHYEDWLFLGGEFGGNSYAIERASGVDDIVTYRELRVYLGLERKLNGGAGFHLEAGYSFGRRLEYESATPDVDVDDTALLRGGFTF